MRCITIFLLLAMSLIWAGEIIVDAPKEITKEWEEKVFGIKYEVTGLDKAVHEMVDGLIDDIFDEPFFERIKEVVKNHPKGEGLYTEYWPNGVLKSKLPYKDGKADGHIHGWYDNGLDAFKGHFKEGVKQGIHITFYKVEPKGYVNKVRLLSFNEKGQLDRDATRNHKTGGLWIAAEYENGKSNGALEGWDQNRKYFLSANYKNGILQKKPPLPPGKRKVRKSSPYVGYVHEVTETFLKIAKKEFGATCGGAGSGIPFDVETITVYLSIKKKGTVEEARELIVKLSERFVEVINQHEKLRPYLREYPFTPMRASVMLDFCDEKWITNKDGSVARVILTNKGRVCYRTIKSKDSQPEDLYNEPYEEALKIVKSKGQKL